MANAPGPPGHRGRTPDDGWGPATPVHSSSYASPAGTAAHGAALPPVRGRTPHSTFSAPAQAGAQPGYGGGPQTASASRGSAPGYPADDAPAERGLPAWLALVVLLGIAGVGGLIDTISGAQVRGGFNIGIVVASVVAILAVKRSAMFPVVIAPPLVYSGASAVMLYVRSSGLHDRRVLFDGAANWLVYGFPAIAAATAAVLIIAGIRLIARR